MALSKIVSSSLANGSVSIASITDNTVTSVKLTATGVVANSYGNTTAIPVITVDAQGRITNATTSSVSGVTGLSFTPANSTITVSTSTTNFDAVVTSGNSTVQGLLKVIDSVSNTSTSIAASANSVTTAYRLAANAVSNATAYAATAYSNAVATAASDATTKAGTAYSNAVATAASDATTKAGTAYSNATTYAATIAGTAYSNAVSVAASDATTKAGTAYSNAISYANTAAGTAYSNAISYANTVAYTAAGTAYTNAIAIAASDATTKANAAYSNVFNGGTFSGAVTVQANLTANSVRMNGDLQIDGNLTVSGNSVTINVTNLNVDDNMIYLNSNSTVSHPDLGFAGNYNDGSYKHAGLFRDATDGVWKFFHGYTPEPDASAFIDTANTSFALSNVQINYVIGNVTGSANSATYLGGNTASTLRTYSDTIAGTAYSNATTYAATIAGTAYSNAVSVAASDATTKAGTAYSNATTYAATIAGTAYSNATTYAATIAGTAYSNAVSVAASDATTKAGTAYSNATTYAATIAGTAYSNAVSVAASDATTKAGTAYSNATTYAATIAGTAYSNATTYAATIAGTAYSNATAFAANASNITSGTLTTARLPATANISTSINVGANVNISTLRINVGNSTVNTVITSTSITGNGAGITGVNAATVGSNTATTLRTYSDTVAGTAYSNATTYAATIAGTAYSNAVSVAASDATTKAGTAYSNATAFAANASNISSGTLSASRLPATYLTSVTGTAPVVSSGGSTPAISMAAANSTVAGYMTTAYASKLNGIATGATNVTNNNQLTNGAGYITGYTETDTLATVTGRGSSTTVNSIAIGDSGTDTGLRINHGAGVSDYARLRFYQAGTNNQTIHVFPTTWQGGTLACASAGAINIQGVNGATFGPWNAPDMWIDTGGISQSRVSSRAPIFYDSGNTGYYLDPAGTSILNNLDGPALNDSPLYLRTKSDTNHYLWNAADDWEELVAYHGTGFRVISSASYGTLMTFYGGSNGNYVLTNAGSMRAPLFYDSNDTGYYIDPNTTSDSALRIRGGALHGPNVTWSSYLLVGGDGRQNYTNSATTASVCSTNGNLHIDSASGFSTHINWYDGTDLIVGAGDSASGRFYVYGSSNYSYATGSMRAPLFYDSGDTAYYLDPSGNSNLSTTITGVAYFRSDRDTSSSSAPLQAYSSGGGGATMAFHRGGVYAINFGLDSDNVIRFGGWSAGANRLQMDMSGNLTMAGNVTAYSDIRLKENIEVISDALQKVKAIRGVTFTRNDQDDKIKRHTGVIAQEVEVVMPEVVSEDNSGVKNVAYGNMVGLLIEAIKEQQKLIETLAEKVKVLESK